MTKGPELRCSLIYKVSLTHPWCPQPLLGALDTGEVQTWLFSFPAAVESRLTALVVGARNFSVFPASLCGLFLIPVCTLDPPKKC